MSQAARFRETQPWRLNRLLRIKLPKESLILSAVLLGVGANASPADQKIMAAVWFGLGVVFPAAFLSWRLTTEVTGDLLRARFVGLPGWRIPLDRVAHAERVRVDAMRDFGGWGWRYRRAFGQVFNVWGDHAVRVTLTDGRIRTLGTQRPDELLNAVLAGAIGEPVGPARAPGY